MCVAFFPQSFHLRAILEERDATMMRPLLFLSLTVSRGSLALTTARRIGYWKISAFHWHPPSYSAPSFARHPLSFVTEDECVRVPRMVAGAPCEFIAAESSTYERWLRFESRKKKKKKKKKSSLGQWSIFSTQTGQHHHNHVSVFPEHVAFSILRLSSIHVSIVMLSPKVFIILFRCNLICMYFMYFIFAVKQIDLKLFDKINYFDKIKTIYRYDYIKITKTS